MPVCPKRSGKVLVLGSVAQNLSKELSSQERQVQTEA